MSFKLPYENIRVVDISHALAGPYCGMILARLGADVIKVESIEGEISRQVGQAYSGMQTDLSIAVNLGKRDIAVDLKSEAGREILTKLITSADVFIENFRPGVLEKLGFSYEQVSKLNDQIIYLSSSGWGHAGPFKERPGTDTEMQAFSGFMASNAAKDRVPNRSKVIWVDVATAMYNAQTIQAALWSRLHEGKGCYIENSLLESAAAFQSYNILNAVLHKPQDTPYAIYPFGNFICADGYIQFSVMKDAEFKPFMKMLGLAELGNDERLQTAEDRYKHRGLIDQPINDAVKKLTVDELGAKLNELRMLYERINDYQQFLEHEQTKAMDAFLWVDYPDVGRIPLANIPGTERLTSDSKDIAAPRLGEHTREILKELNYTDSQIERLVKDNHILCDCP